MLCDDDDIAGVDIDHRIVDGEIDPEVLAELEALDTYAERSPSGDGLRAIVRARLPSQGCKTGNFEIYETGRYLTITGQHLEGSPTAIENRQAEVEAFHARRIAKPKPKSVRKGARPHEGGGRDPGRWSRAVPGPLTDRQVLARLSKKKNAAKFNAIYAGGDSYHGGDTSRADLALCSMLSVYTHDVEQIDRLFRNSPRMRDKWDEPHYSDGTTYGNGTIQVALKEVTETATGEESGPGSGVLHVVPRPGAWPEVAEAFREQRGRPIVRHLGVFYEWTGSFWHELEDATIRTEFWRWLSEAKYEQGNDLLGWSPNTTKVNNAVDALQALAHISGVQVPGWISGTHAEDPADLVPMRNGLLYVPERRLLPPTPEYFNLSAVPYDYDPDAPKPVQWLRFLDDVFEHDPTAPGALQEMFGYLLLTVTWLHKIFGIFGPARSGKGIILRTLERMVGAVNVAAPTFEQLGYQFGRASLVGKSVAVITDARVTTATRIGGLVETLLTISGEDTVQVHRKYKGDWVGRLGVRFVIASNEVPFFPDASMALANRFEPFTTRKSYLGKQDHGLEARIADEIPGILNWALDGYDRLVERGWFEGPESGDDILDTMEASSSPITQFVEECCELGPEHSVEKGKLFQRWRVWADDQGISRGSMGTLTMYLNAAYPGAIKDSKKRKKDGSRVMHYQGLRLRNGDGWGFDMG